MAAYSMGSFNTHPRSRSLAVGDAETGPKIREDGRRQPLGHDVGELLRGGNMKNPNVAERNFLSYKMDVKFDVFRPAMMHWVGGHVDRGHVVAVHQRGAADRAVQLREKLPQPGALSDGVRNSTVLSLSARARDCRLPF